MLHFTVQFDVSVQTPAADLYPHVAHQSKTPLSFSITNILHSPDKRGRTAAGWCPLRSGPEQQTGASTTATPQVFVCL